MVRAFLESARRGDWEAAARHLAPEAGPDRIRLARELAAVIDDRVRVDLESLSDEPEGRQDDRLASDTEDVGVVALAGVDGRLRLVRLPDERWVFSSATLSMVPEWYATLDDLWLREHLPEPLLRRGWRGLYWWQWLALPFYAAAAMLIGRLVAVGLRALLRALTRRTRWKVDEALADRLRGPSILLCATLVGGLGVRFVGMTEEGAASIGAMVEALLLATVFWTALRAVDHVSDAMRGSEFVRRHPQSMGLLPLGGRVAKIALAIVAVVTVLQRLGYPAASLVAGLGIGGLAFALAAQKTVENLFGSVTLGVDQPFRPGDFVKVEDVLGTIESVGLRSTRIRTLERTLVTLPNGRLADMRIETFSARDRFRFFQTVPLPYDTPAATVDAIVSDIRVMLQTHPQRGEGDVMVGLRGFGPGSLDVDVAFWLATTQGVEFWQLRQEVLLALMEVVEKHGARLAMPAQSLHVASLPSTASRPPRGEGAA